MIRCAKMNGNGNDFLVIDNGRKRIDDETLSRMARLLCRRRESVGADGLLVFEPSTTASFRMRVFNSDGSEGAMCGNGARCMARYACEQTLAPPKMTFETDGGTVTALVEGRRVSLTLAPVPLEGIVIDEPLVVGDEALRYSFLTVGVPHGVVFLNRPLSEREMTFLGSTMRHDRALFPEGANINFVTVDDEGLFVATYERGVEALTLSCGTGSTASAIVACLTGRSGPEATVRNPGGVQEISLLFEGRISVVPSLAGLTTLVGWVEASDEALL